MDAHTVAIGTITTLQSIRDDDSFDLFWEKVRKHATRLNVDNPKLTRVRKQPSNLNDYFGYGKGKDKDARFQTTKDAYRKHYFEAFDLAINSIQQRFDQKDYKTYALSQQVLLKSARNESCETEISDLLKFYAGDFDELLLQGVF